MIEDVLKKHRKIIAIILVAIVGFLVELTLTSSRGVGLASDSVSYIHDARDICHHGLVSRLHYPPLFPFSLAVIHWLSGVDPLIGARWLNAMLFGSSVFLAGFLINRYTNFGLAILGALWLIVKIEILDIYSWAMSEPLFIFSTLLWILFLIEFLRTQRLALLLAFSMAALAASATRYFGVSLILTSVVIFILERKTIPRFLSALITFLSINLVPSILWLIMNSLGKKDFLSRTFNFHPIPIIQFKIYPWPLNTNYGYPLLPLFFMGIIVLLGWFLWKKRDVFVAEKRLAQIIRFAYVTILLIFIYLLLWFVDWYFFDAVGNVPKYGIPLEIWGMFVFLSCIYVLFSSNKGYRLLKIFYMIILSIYLVVVNLFSAIPWALKRFSDGTAEFDNKNWDNSEIIREVKKIPPQAKVYTNNVNALYILANRESRELEPRIDRYAAMANPGYMPLMRRMREDLQKRNARIVFCYNWFLVLGLPTITELTKELPLKRVVKVSDGEIYAWDSQK